MFNKKLLSSIDLGKYEKKNPYKKDMILDPMGQWKHPGKNTRIPFKNKLEDPIITMKGVNYPVLGIANTGQKQMMQPGREYSFPGADYVDEYPQMAAGGSSEQKIIFAPKEGGCPDGEYWTGTECKPIPKNTKIVYSQEELDKLNISKKEQQRLYNEYIGRINKKNAIDSALKKKYGPIQSKEKFYSTFESIPGHGFSPMMSYGPASLTPNGLGPGIPSMNETMVDFKTWKKMLDKSPVKPIGYKGHPGGGHFYPIYEKPNNYILGYNREEKKLDIEPIKPPAVPLRVDNGILPPLQQSTYVPQEPIEAPQYTLDPYTAERPYLDVQLPQNKIKRLFDRGVIDSKGHIELGRKDKTRLIPRIVQKVTGYDPAYFEGSYDEEGKYIPGELDYGNEVGGRMEFRGAASLQDLINQQKYAKEWEEYERKIDEREEQSKKKQEQGQAFKKGGSKTKYTSDIINSTNYLFAEHPLFKKKKQSKKRIYSPNAKYYADGGENLQEECPPYHYWNGETCVPVSRELAPLDPQYLSENPDVATNMQIEPEVSVSPLGSDFSKAKSWIDKWHDSPMHDKMLMKSLKLSNQEKLFKEYKDKRKKNIQTIPALDIDFDKTNPAYKEILEEHGFSPWGSSNFNTGAVSVYDSYPGNNQMLIHEVSHSSDRPDDKLGRLIPYNDQLTIQYRTPLNWKNTQYGKDIMKLYKENGWQLDEIDASRGDEIPRDIYEQQQFDDWNKYLLGDQGTEVRARLNEIRQGAQEKNIYDPFNKKITGRQFKNLKNLKYPKPLDELRKTFSDKDIRWMLNNISKNNNETEDAIQYSKKGGALPEGKYGYSVGNLIRKQFGGGLPKAQFGLTGMGKYPALTATPFDFRTSYGQASDFNKNPNYSLTYTVPRLFKKAELAGNPLSFTLGRPYNTDAESLTNRSLNFIPQEGLFSSYYDPATQGASNPQYQQYLQNVSDTTGTPVSELNQTVINQYNAAKNLAGAKPLYKKGIPLTANIGWDAYGTAFGDSSSGPFTGYGSLNVGYAPEPGFYGTADFGMMGVFGKRKNNASIKPQKYFDKGLIKQGDRAFIPKLNILNFALRQRPEYNDIQTQQLLDLYQKDIEQGTKTAEQFLTNKTDEKRFDLSFLSPEATFQIKPFKNIPGVASITGGLRLDYGGKDTSGDRIPITPKPYGNVRYTVPLDIELPKNKIAHLFDKGVVDRDGHVRIPKRTYSDYAYNQDYDEEYTDEYTGDTPEEEIPTENNFEVNPPELQINPNGTVIRRGDCPEGYERPCEKCRCQKIKIPQSYIDKRGKQLFGNEPIAFEDGGDIQLKLTKKEIDKYVKGGYIVEDISVPSLTRMDNGGYKGEVLKRKRKRKKQETEPVEPLNILQPGEELFPLPTSEERELYYEPISLKEMSPEELEVYKAEEQERLKYESDKAALPGYFDEAMQWVKDWHNSPMYNQMVLKSNSGQQKKADDLTKLRKKNIETIPPLVVSEKKYEIPAGSEEFDIIAAATSDHDTGEIEIYPGGFHTAPSTFVHEILHGSDRPRDLYSWDYPAYKTGLPIDYFNKKGIDLGHWVTEMENDNVIDVPDWMLYEDPRFDDEGLIWHNRIMPKKDQMYITTHRGSNWKDNERYKKENAKGLYTIKTDKDIENELSDYKNDPNYKEIFKATKELPYEIIEGRKKDWKNFGHNYVSIPTEVRARLGEIRYNAQKEGIYDPFTEQITPEIFQNYINKEIYMPPINDLREEYTDEEILWMLQNISKNKSQEDESNIVQYGKMGGEKRKRKNKNKEKESETISLNEKIPESTYTPIDPNWLAANPGTYSQIVNKSEVPTERQGSDIGKLRAEYRDKNPMDIFLDEKKRQYLKKNKGLNKAAGVTMENFPDVVLQNFINEYDYKTNNYAVNKLGKKEGWNPRRRGEWVTELTPGEREAVAESKYGSKLQPSYWSRSLAGVQELGNTLLPGQPFQYNIPGLIKKEQKEMRDSKLSALEILAPIDIPGAAIANLAKNTGLSTGSDYKEQPNVFAGEKMANVSDMEAMAFNPLTYAGVEAIPELGINMVKGARNLSRGVGKNIAKGYEALATGNSPLPIAWKLENPSPLESILQNKNYNLTDEEAEIINEYIKNPYIIKSSPEKSKMFADIIRKNQVDLSNINQPISRYDNYYVSSYDRDPLPTEYGSTFSFPRDRSWSIGIDNNANTRLSEKQRLVIPSRYAKKLNENFHAVNYADSRLTEALVRPYEKELIGNVPEGFKVIGNVKEGNIENIIIKPKKIRSLKKEPKWEIPSNSQLKQEFKVEHELKGNTFFESEDQFMNAIKNATVEEITPELDASIGYRSRTASKDALVNMSKGYKSWPKFRNEGTIDAIYEGLSTGKKMDMPIVLEFPNGTRRIFSGNTRMDASFQLGKNPKVLVVKVPIESPSSPNIFDNISDVTKTELNVSNPATELPYDLEKNRNAAAIIEDLKYDRYLKINSPEGKRRIEELIANNPHMKNMTYEDVKQGFANMVNENAMQAAKEDELLILNQKIKNLESSPNPDLAEIEKLKIQANNLEGEIVLKEMVIEEITHNARMRRDRPVAVSDPNTTKDNFDLNKDALPSDIWSVLGSPEFTVDDLSRIIPHEFGHYFQQGAKTNLDDMLSKISLKTNDSSLNSNLFSDEKGASNFFNRIMGGGDSFNRMKKYWKQGGKGQEKTAFMEEVRADMLQRGMIEDLYQTITPELLKDHYLKYMAEVGNKYPLRIYDIMKNNSGNFKIMSNVLNKMPALVPIGAVGAGMMMQNNEENNIPKQKRGGIVSELSKKEIDKLIKQGYIIEEID